MKRVPLTLAEVKDWWNAPTPQKGLKLRGKVQEVRAWVGDMGAEMTKSVGMEGPHHVPTPSRVEVLRFERIFAPRSAWEYLAYCALAISLNYVSGLFGTWMSPFCFALVVVMFGIMWYRDRRKAEAITRNVTFEVSKELPKSCRGLILLVGPYDPRHQALRDRNVLLPMIEDFLKKPVNSLTQEEFGAINLFHSNLQPQLDAIAFHAEEEPKRLRDVWLITTEGDAGDPGSGATGSTQAGDLLERYIGFKYASRIDVHRQGADGRPLSVKPWDYKTLCQIAESIFRSSDYREDVLLADVTGGTKMMSVALAIACLPPTRKMQYMDSFRDWQGQPVDKGKTKPIVMDIDPILYGGR